MDLISEIIAPILERYDGKPPTFTVSMASYATSARVHLGERCKNATIKDRRGADLIGNRTLCSRCGKLGAHITDAEALVIADAFALQAAARARAMLRTSTSDYYSGSHTGERVTAMLDRAAVFAGTTHPAAPLLLSLIPSRTVSGSGDLLGVAALAATTWEMTTADEREWVRVLAGATYPADKLWPTVRRTVLAGQSIDLAVVSAIAGIEQGAGATLKTLPNTLMLQQDDYQTTTAWMRAEWDAATATARTGLAASMHKAIDAQRDDTTGDRWVIVSASRTEVSRARERARRHNWMLSVGNSSRWNGLICAPLRVLEALTFLSSDQANFTLIGNDDAVAAELVEAVRRSPEILRIAEQFKMDDESINWDVALERAALVPAFD